MPQPGRNDNGGAALDHFGLLKTRVVITEDDRPRIWVILKDHKNFTLARTDFIQILADSRMGYRRFDLEGISRTGEAAILRVSHIPTPEVSSPFFETGSAGLTRMRANANG